MSPPLVVVFLKITFGGKQENSMAYIIRKTMTSDSVKYSFRRENARNLVCAASLNGEVSSSNLSIKGLGLNIFCLIKTKKSLIFINICFIDFKK
jgi:hypothetical protein